VPGSLFGDGKDASENAGSAGEQRTIACPLCGEPQKNLPTHIRSCGGDSGA
jgi:hypothetical protein